MLKMNFGGWQGNYLQGMQWLFGVPNSVFMHAGIMSDSFHIVEAQITGIKENDLRTDNRNLGYAVFRCTSGHAARGAATCAKMFCDIHKETGNLPYNLVGAHQSLSGTGGGHVQSPKQMHQLLDDVLEKKGGRARPFFCSEFVVYVYQFVAEQNRFNSGYFFSQSAAKMPPGELFDTLMHDPLKKFGPVGMMAPGERE